jgi:hypothetical protein
MIIVMMMIIITIIIIVIVINIVIMIGIVTNTLLHVNTFPVRRLGVYVGYLKLVNRYCPSFPIFAQSHQSRDVAEKRVIALAESQLTQELLHCSQPVEF